MANFKQRIELENVTVVKDSGQALLCDIDGDEVWIPQSQIDDDSEVYREGDSGKLIISEWIALQKGLI